VLVDFLARARGHRRERGSLTVEFALVVPVLIAIMFGIIDMGRFVATRTMLSQSAAIGGRAACLGNATTTTVNDAVRDSAPGVAITVDWSNSTCLPAPCTMPRAAGDTVNLRVQYNFVPGFYSSLRRTITNDSRVICN
jgi:Flp pilus assembly protein TadG